MSDIKLCKDCLYNKEHWIGLEFSACQRPDFKATNPVTGDISIRHQYSGTQRKFDWLCGERARYFYPKPPSRWQRFLEFLTSTEHK